MKISASDWNALPEGLKKAFSKVEGSDEYTNGEEDAASLKSALDREREEKKEAARLRDEYKAKVDAEEAARKKAEEEKQRKSGDFTKIEEDYKSKIAALEADKAKIQADAQAAVAKLAEDSVLSDVTSVFAVPGAMRAMVASRLKTEIVDGKAITRVLNANGEPTAMSPAELKKEFLDNKEFKPILAASKGGGGGATPPTEGGGATSGKPFDAAGAAPKDFVAHLEAKGVGRDES